MTGVLGEQVDGHAESGIVCRRTPKVSGGRRTSGEQFPRGSPSEGARRYGVRTHARARWMYWAIVCMTD